MNGKLCPLLTVVFGFGLVYLTAPQAADPLTFEGSLVATGTARVAARDLPDGELAAESNVSVPGKTGRLDAKQVARVHPISEGSPGGNTGTGLAPDGAKRWKGSFQ